MTTTPPTPESVLTGALWGLDFADPECDNLARALLRRSPTLASAIALGLAWQRASAALPEGYQMGCQSRLSHDFDSERLEQEGAFCAWAEHDGEDFLSVLGVSETATLIALAEALEARRGE